MQGQSKAYRPVFSGIIQYICMVMLLILFLLLFDPWDRLLSTWFRAHAIESFVKFMDQSLFEGESLGAGDFTAFLQLVTLLLWLVSFLPPAPKRLVQGRSLLASILASSILTAVAVHLGKGLVARPRPFELDMHPTLVSSWFGLQHRLLHGWGHGSFPSGHTANAISLIAFYYALRVVNRPRQARMFATLLWLFVLAMATSRVMAGAHWPTDTIASMLLGWLIAWGIFRRWKEKHSNSLL